MMRPRLYADASGDSHFEDVEVALETRDFTPPAPPIDVSAFHAARRFVFLEVPAGWDGAAHPAPLRGLFVFLSGDWEVTAGSGETRRFGPGDALLVEDTSGKGHTTRMHSPVPARAILIELA